MSSTEEVKRLEQLQPTIQCARVVRISVTDPDATDSSSDEESCHTSDHHGKRKKFITEIEINPPMGKQKADDGNPNTGGGRKKTRKSGRGAEKVESSNVEGAGKKFRGVRQWLWGKWAAEIRDNKIKKRLWLGTFDTSEEAAIAYDHAAIRLHGHNAVTNLIPPPSVDDMNPVHAAFDYLHGTAKRASSMITLEDHVPCNCLNGFGFM